MTHLMMVIMMMAPPGEVAAAKVDTLPTIDGKAGDAAWSKAKTVTVKIDDTSELENPMKEMTLKAVHDGDSVCVLLVWSDKTKNVKHFEWVWAGGEYEEGDEAEDACTLAFGLKGNFNPDMLTPAESTWDVWHWGAQRGSGGYALDRVHHYTKKKLDLPGARSKRRRARDRSYIYITRPDDAGTPPARQVEAPEKKKGDRIPQFVTQKPTGSCADVQAAGAWSGGKWTVEFRRKLRTGNADDAAFDASTPVPFAVARFDNDEGSGHQVSRGMLLRLQK